MDQKIDKNHIDNSKNKLEKDVREFLQNINFNIIDADSKIYTSQNIIVGELDIIANFDDYLFLIEVNGDKTARSKKSIAFFSIWSEQTNVDLINKKYQLRTMRIIKLYFDLTKNSSDEESAAKDHLTKINENLIIYLDQFDYFVKYVKKVGTWAKNDFINFLGISDSSQTRSVHAIQYYIRNIPVFTFVERVDRLLQTCYVSRKRGNELVIKELLMKTE